MIPSLLVALTTALFGGAFGASDTFFFTQCECPSFVFNAEPGGNAAIGAFTQSGSPLFTCPGDGPIPDDTGVDTDFNQAVSTDAVLQANVLQAFQETDLGEQTFWHASFDFEYNTTDIPLGDVIQLVNFEFDSFQLTTTIDGRDVDSVLFGLADGDSSASIAVADEGSLLKTLIVGVIDVTASAASGFACLRTDFETKCINVFTGVPITSAAEAGIVKVLDSDGTSAESNVRLKAAQFTEDIDFAADISTFFTALAAFINLNVPAIPTAVPLPLVDLEQGFATTEDQQGSFDLNSAFPGNALSLEFSDLITEAGIISSFDAALGTFNYDPAADQFGLVPFSFGYEDVNSVFTCVLSGSSQFNITQVDDAPVAFDQVFDVFASVAFPISAKVATSGDFASGNLEEGSIEIASAILAGTLFEADCETELTFPAVIAINETEVEFCFLPNVDFLSGSSADLQYTISTVGATFTIDGQMTFNGNAPIEALDSVLTTDEDVVAILEVSSLVNLAQFDFDDLTTISIKSLPNVAHGIITDLNDNPLAIDAVLAFDDIIKFVPEADFFNSNEDAEGTDFFGDDFAFAATSFTFSAIVGEFESELATVDVVVVAQDDEEPVLTLPGDVVVVESVDPTLSELEVPSPQDISIVSDAGAGFFPITLFIEVPEGSSFKFAADPRVPSIVNGSSTEDDATTECSITDCISATVTSTPAELVTLLSGIVFTFPVVAEAQSTVSTFTVVYDVEGSVEENQELVFNLEIDQIESALTAIAFETTTFAGLPVEFSNDVARNAEGFLLEKGSVTIDVLPTRGGLFRAGCVDALALNDVVALVDTKFNFCYVPDATMLDDEVDAIQYTVATQTEAFTVAGSINFLGATPARTLSPVNISAIDEGETVTIITADLIEVILVNEEASPVVEITQVPDPSEATLVSGGSVVNAGDFLAVDSEFVFTPAANFFNLNDEGENVNFFGGPINTGLISFSYRAEFNGVFGLEEQFPLEILAVDNANPSVSRPTDEVIGVTADPDEEIISATVTNFEVVSDNGVGFFPIRVQVDAPEGVNMSLTADDIPSAGSFVGGCIDAPCTSFQVESTPAEIEDLLNAVAFSFPAVLNATVNYKVEIFVAAEDEVLPQNVPSFAVDFAVTRPLAVDGDDGDDDEIFFGLGAQDLGIYGGAGLGGLILLGLIGVYVVKRRGGGDDEPKANEGLFKDEEIDPAVDI